MHCLISWHKLTEWPVSSCSDDLGFRINRLFICVNSKMTLLIKYPLLLKSKKGPQVVVISDFFIYL